jgi:hypothetical protein
MFIRNRTVFGPYLLPVDSDSVFVSAHYPLRFWIQKKYGNEYGFTTIRPRIRSVFTPSHNHNTMLSEFLTALIFIQHMTKIQRNMEC